MDNKPQPKPLTVAEISGLAFERVSLISKEFAEGFEFLKNYPRSVSIFGSTRMKESDPFYNKACNLSKRIVKELKYSIVTGGGPGVMEAANKGAYEAGGNSIGLLIELPDGQPINKYLTDSIRFHHFFSRKVALSFAAEAYVFFPGGFGTLDEFSEILTLVQTMKIAKIPIILVGVEYWSLLIDFFKEKMLESNMISENDLELFTLTDDDDKIIEIIKNAPVTFGVPHNHGMDDDK